MARVHPTAVVDPTARLAADAVVGPFCVVEADVEIGAGTELRPHAIVRRYTTLGAGNLVDSFAVLGGLPQDLKFGLDTVTGLRVGDGNVFREGVTISRATKPGTATIVGNNTYWMTGSHAGHDATVEDNVILTNNASVGGHATVARRTILSANVGVHQFCWVGEMVMFGGQGGASTHVPPFVLMGYGVNNLVGLNSVGLRRAPDITEEDRRQVKNAFRLTYRAGLTPAMVVAEMDAWTDISPAAVKWREFLRKVLSAERPHKRALCPHRRATGGGE
jgi:UDP-N-acetylglucosamine acyltransferase